jgi:hypothetical protein
MSETGSSATYLEAGAREMLHDILIIILGIVIFVASYWLMDAFDPRNKRK